MSEFLESFIAEFNLSMYMFEENVDKAWKAGDMVNEYKLKKGDLEAILVIERDNIDAYHFLQPILDTWEEETLAAQCVNKIIEDLTDRSGFGNAWESIDEDIQNEIKETWAEIIDKIM